MKPTVVSIRINHSPVYSLSHARGYELRIDFSNDRHHAVLIDSPCDRESLIKALLRLTAALKSDPHLEE
jgi:hypothetical protein